MKHSVRMLETYTACRGTHTKCRGGGKRLGGESLRRFSACRMAVLQFSRLEEKYNFDLFYMVERKRLEH